MTDTRGGTRFKMASERTAESNFVSVSIEDNQVSKTGANSHMQNKINESTSQPEENIDSRVHTNCPPGIQFLESYSRFVFNLQPKNVIGDLEISVITVLPDENDCTEPEGEYDENKTIEGQKEEVILISEKHLSSIALLDAVAKSEVLMVDNVDGKSNVTISCPPLDNMAEITLLTSSRLQIATNDSTFYLAQQSDPSLEELFNQEIRRTKKWEAGKKTSTALSNGIKVADINTHTRKICISFMDNILPLEKAIILAGVAVLCYGIKSRRKKIRWCQIITIIIAALFIITILVEFTVYDQPPTNESEDHSENKSSTDIQL